LRAFYRDVAARMFPDLTTAEGIEALEALPVDPPAPTWNLEDLLAGKFSADQHKRPGLRSLPLAVRIKAYLIGKVYGPFA
jgi:hypothetical protein